MIGLDIRISTASAYPGLSQSFCVTTPEEMAVHMAGDLIGDDDGAGAGAASPNPRPRRMTTMAAATATTNTSPRLYTKLSPERRGRRMTGEAVQHCTNDMALMHCSRMR